MKNIKPPKYKIGDKVYTYQNPFKKRGITFIRVSNELDGHHLYKVSLIDKDGYSYSSNFINEKSVSKTVTKDIKALRNDIKIWRGLSIVPKSAPKVSSRGNIRITPKRPKLRR